MLRYLRMTILALVGAWIGGQLAAPLDEIFTDGGAIICVFALFGMWAGAVIAGGALFDTLRLLPRGLPRLTLALLAMALTALAFAYGVIKIADGFLLLASIYLGAAFALFQCAGRNRFRYLIIALVLGALAGSLVSAAGGVQPVSKAIQALKATGVEQFLADAKEGAFHHYYLGRDREEMALIGVISGFFGLLLFDYAVSILHAFINALTRGYRDGTSKTKTKQDQRKI